MMGLSEDLREYAKELEIDYVDFCPVHALDGWKGKYDPEEGWVMDKKKCYEYIFTILKSQRCGLCIKVCPVGLNEL